MSNHMTRIKYMAVKGFITYCPVLSIKKILVRISCLIINFTESKKKMNLNLKEFKSKLISIRTKIKMKIEKYNQ